MISCNKQGEHFNVTVDGYRQQCSEELASLIGSIYVTEIQAGMTEQEVVDHITEIANNGLRIGRANIHNANKNKEK